MLNLKPIARKMPIARHTESNALYIGERSSCAQSSERQIGGKRAKCFVGHLTVAGWQKVLVHCSLRDAVATEHSSMYVTHGSASMSAREHRIYMYRPPGERQTHRNTPTTRSACDFGIL